MTCCGDEQIMGCLDFGGSYCSYEASFNTEKILFQQILRHCIMSFYRCVLQTELLRSMQLMIYHYIYILI